MEYDLASRVAVVEEKVDVLEAMEPKITTIYDYVTAEQAKKALIRNALIAIGGFIAFLGTLWTLISAVRGH